MAEIGAQIKTQVKSDLLLISGMSSVGDRSTVRQQFDETIRTEVEGVLKGVQEAEREIGIKDVWLLLKLSRARYKKDVIDAWNRKKQPIEGFVREALQAQKNGEVTIAIKNLILAMDLLKKVFNGLPLVMKVDGADREMASFLPARLEQILGNITVKPLQKSVMVGHSGVRVRVAWQCMYEGGPIKVPVKNMPFKASMGTCQGKFNQNSQTDTNGVLTTRVGTIGDCSQAILKADMDLRELVGDLVDRDTLDAVRIKPSGTQAVVRQSAVGYITSIGGMGDTIESVVSDLGFEVVRLRESASGASGAGGRARLYQRGVSYLLVVGTSCSAGYIPLYKMYKARVSAVVKLINTRTGKVIRKSAGARGMDVSKTSACSSGRSKLGSRVQNMVRDVLGNINNGL